MPSHFRYCCASSQLTSRTGAFGLALVAWAIFGQPLAVAQAFHCCTVTSNFPIAKGASMTTWCTGRSLGSLALLPIAKRPAGSETSTGQDWQSRISPLARGDSAMCAGAGVVAAGGFVGAAFARAGAVPAAAAGPAAGLAAVPAAVPAAAAPAGARRRAMRACASAAKRPFG